VIQPKALTLPCTFIQRPAESGGWLYQLGRDGGSPQSGAVGGAQRSGPLLRWVDGGAQPAEPRVWPLVIESVRQASKVRRSKVEMPWPPKHPRPQGVGQAPINGVDLVRQMSFVRAKNRQDSHCREVGNLCW